jgi:hypothetical protein
MQKWRTAGSARGDDTRGEPRYNVPDRSQETAMGYDKGHKEFFKVDMNEGFHPVPGYPPGFFEKIIAGGLDEKNKVGNRTRILKIEPGAYSTKPFVHEYWEEVYLVSGDLICGNDDKGQGGDQYTGPTYCVRPPGVYHGPFTSKTGCLLLETHYFA